MRTHPAGSAHTKRPHPWQTMRRWVLIPRRVKSSCAPFVSQRSSNSSFLFPRKLFSHDDAVSCFYCASSSLYFCFVFFYLPTSMKGFSSVTYVHLGLNAGTKQRWCDDCFHMFTRITGRDYSSSKKQRSVCVTRNPTVNH